MPSPISDIINVAVNVSKTASALMSLNLGLIIGQSTIISTTQRVRMYSNLAAMVSDGFSITSDEYLAAQLYFLQNPRPMQVAIGRWNNPTETALQAVSACRTANTTWYGCYVCGASKSDIIAIAGYIDSVFPTSAFFYDTHDSDVIGGVTGNVMQTLKSSSTHRTVGIYSGSSFQTAGYETGATGGSTDIHSGTATTFKIAVDGGPSTSVTLTITNLTTGYLIAAEMQRAIQALGAGFAGVTVAYINGAYVITSGTTGATSSIAITAGTANDVAATLKIGAANGAVDTAGTVTYHHTAASLLGYAMGANTGLANSAYTLMFKSLPGINTDSLTSPQIQYIEGVNGNVYINRGGTYNMVETGITADGTPFDQLLGLDILSNNLQISIMNLLTSAPKVAQTDTGVNSILNVIADPCNSAKSSGFIAPGIWTAPQFFTLNTGDVLPDGYIVMADTIANMSAADKAARKAPPIFVALKLAGAVQSVALTVNVNS